MLMMIGPAIFEMTGLNHNEFSIDGKKAFAKHDVLGTAPIYENVGDDEHEFSVSGKLLPKHLGGLGGVAVIHSMRDSGIPWMAVRGDGAVLGWYVIISVKEKHGEIDFDGVGQEVEFSISLKRSGAPGVADFMSAFDTIAGGF